MAQQINLALSTLPTGRSMSEARMFAMAMGALIIVMSGIYILEWFDTRELRAKLAKTQQEHAASVAKIDDKTLATGLSEPELAIIIEQREKILREKRMLITELLGGPNLAAPGFSHFLEGLAQFKLEDLWITEFTVGAQNGSAIELIGEAKSAERVADLIRGLSQQNIFQGMEVAELEIEDQRPEGTIYFRMLLAGGNAAAEFN